MKKSYPDTLASALDDLISKGGTWEQLENEGNKHAVRLGFKTRCTPGIIKAHIKYRQIKDPNYLGRNKITDKGIEFFQTVIQTADRLPLSTSIIEGKKKIPVRDESPKVDQVFKRVTNKSKSLDDFQLSHPDERPNPQSEEQVVDYLSPERSPEAITIDIAEGQCGISFEKLFLPYLKGARSIKIYDPYIRLQHQVFNLLAFCKILVPSKGTLKLKLLTASDSYQETEVKANLNELKIGLSHDNIEFDFIIKDNIHDRWIETDTGWRIILGRGLDIFQKSDGKFTLGFIDQTKRKCKATTITYTRIKQEQEALPSLQPNLSIVRPEEDGATIEVETAAINRLPLSTSRIERMDTIPAKTPGFVGLDKIHAREIIENATKSTKPRWSQYGESWQNIDIAFILRGYEQQGFQFFKMKPVLEDLKILSIDSLGTILLKYPDKRSYDRQFAGSMTSEFYMDLQKGICGREGQLFAESARTFLDQKMGSPGRTFWKLLYQMLEVCTYLKRHYSSSFAKYVIAKYASYARKPHITNNDFLNMSVSEWENFLIKAEPWSELMGIGPNVFDFIMGDTIEAQFVVNSFKFDSANQHFFKVTGIAEQIVPFDRENTTTFLKALDLPYTLREINKGVYTYCSKTENKNFGFCLDLKTCRKCRVEAICAKNL